MLWVLLGRYDRSVESLFYEGIGSGAGSIKTPPVQLLLRIYGGAVCRLLEARHATYNIEDEKIGSVCRDCST